MSDSSKILQLLQTRGSRGLHSFEIVQLVHTIRGAARILDLKKLGHKITSIPERMGNSVGCRYFLNHFPDVGKKIEYRFEGNKAIPIEEEMLQRQGS